MVVCVFRWINMKCWELIAVDWRENDYILVNFKLKLDEKLINVCLAFAGKEN